MMEIGFISATTLIKLTLMLLCFGFAFTLVILYGELKKVKEAIAIICAADPKLTKKVNELLKTVVVVDEIENKEEEEQ